MAGKKHSKGNCTYCGRKMTKSGMSKHLKSCEKQVAVIDAANAKSGSEEMIFHLQIQDGWKGEFWLHLEVSGKASFSQLDSYLRAIWLECCGHLSEFSVDKRGNEISMDSRVGQILRPRFELFHIYDFGTSSETIVKVVDVRQGKTTTPHPIALMARNDQPEESCIECGKSASWFCIECLYEGEQDGALCDEHADDHPHEEYGEPMPLFNSSRAGMCGYDGPAKPPY